MRYLTSTILLWYNEAKKVFKNSLNPLIRFIMKKLCFLFIVLFFVYGTRASAQINEQAIAEFGITVPAGYDHDTQIEMSKEKAKKDKVKFFGYDSFFTNDNFRKEEPKLLPGETFIVKIFSITGPASNQQYLSFLNRQKAVFFGLHGLTLVFDLKKDQLPKDKWIIVFGPKDGLSADKSNNGDHVVPYINTSSDGDYAFEKSYFENDGWPVTRGCCTLLCFIKKE